MTFKIILISAFLAVVSAQTRVWNLTGCINQFQIPLRGRIVKNICELTQQVTYDQAVAACAAQGMDLFYVEEGKMDIFGALQYYIRTFYQPICGPTWTDNCGFWINGKRVNNAWQVTVNGNTFPYFISWYPTASSGNTGDCKLVRQINSMVGTFNWDCSQLFHPICEYNNTYAVTP